MTRALTLDGIQLELDGPRYNKHAEHAFLSNLQVAVLRITGTLQRVLEARKLPAFALVKTAPTVVKHLLVTSDWRSLNWVDKYVPRVSDGSGLYTLEQAWARYLAEHS